MVVENAFGHLKGRWRCLLKRNDTATYNVPTLITACCVLHNVCEHRVITMNPENSNKMADEYQPQRHTAFIERRNNSESFL